MICKVFHESNKNYLTKVYINEKRNFFFLIVVSKENESFLEEVAKHWHDKKELLEVLTSKKDKILGYGIAEIKKTYNFIVYGVVNVGYGGINKGTYNYVIDTEEINEHYLKEFFLASDAYTCKEENFDLEKALINEEKAASFIHVLR